MNTRPQTPSEGPLAIVGNFAFPQTARLLKSREFKLVTDRGKKVHTPLFLIFFRKNGLDHCRLGVTVSKKVGQAVIRNRVKRWLREYFRHWQSGAIEHWDIVIIARNAANRVSHELFDRTLGSVLNALLPRQPALQIVANRERL
ncbi:MAG: ribonuclease P protein component [Nitrospirae bacterium]|nr:ribonuclease P protein component [Magnetococcales bacterium]HAT49315.1 ribonuclease P protein component [Alphaproteobacteria bacterium]